MRSSNTAKTLRFQGEVNFRPSKTIPDQAMSIQEIMRRYASGLPLSGQRVGFFDAEDPLPDTSKMDLVDMQEAREENQQRILDNQEKLRSLDEEKKQKAAQKAAEKSAKEKADREQKPDDHLTPPKKDQ